MNTFIQMSVSRQVGTNLLWRRNHKMSIRRTPHVNNKCINDDDPLLAVTVLRSCIGKSGGMVEQDNEPSCYLNLFVFFSPETLLKCALTVLTMASGS